MREIRRVLRPDGKLFITVPCKATRNVVYVEKPVYERKTVERNFYAREYDASQFASLVSDSGFRVLHQRYVVETPGFLALDSLEWRSLRGTVQARLMLLLRRALEKFTRRSMDEWLAQRYLTLSEAPRDRLVNVAATVAQ